MLKCNLNLSKCLLQFVRPIRSSHIRIHRSDGTVVFSVDVAITAGVLYPVGSLGRTIQFTTSQTFTEKESYYLTMDHGKDTEFISWSYSLCNRCWTYHPMKSPPYNFLQTFPELSICLGLGLGLTVPEKNRVVSKSFHVLRTLSLEHFWRKSSLKNERLHQRFCNQA